MEVVAAALVSEGRVLASRRTHPEALRGRWELAGGKVETGESDAEALVRELREELGVEVSVGPRLGADLALPHGTLRVYVCSLVSGEPQLLAHDAHRWLGVGELHDVPWLVTNAPVVAELQRLLHP